MAEAEEYVKQFKTDGNNSTFVFQKKIKQDSKHQSNVQKHQ